jgi:hypothetical protein
MAVEFSTSDWKARSIGLTIARERVVMARDHLPRVPINPGGLDGVVTIHREMPADRDQRDVDHVTASDQLEVAEQRGVAQVIDRSSRRARR